LLEFEAKMDIYDKAIEYLKNNPSQIPEVWDDPKSHFSGVLFQSVTPDGAGQNNVYGDYCGDICEIHSNMASAWTNDLTEEIMDDFRIPEIFASHDYKPKITTSLLPLFAEWQRKIDTVLNRNPKNFKYEK
jgi:hypothetical protein